VRTQQCNRLSSRPTPPPRNAKEPEPWEWGSGSKRITRRATVGGVVAWGRRKPPPARCPSTSRKPPVDALKQHKAKQNAERLKADPTWEDNGLIFPSQRGTTMNAKNLTARNFKPILKRTGLPDIRLHELRHTCATLLLSRGVHPKFVQELLGHATIAITLDTYSHVLPGMGDQTATAMEAALT
jgi:hypothetical protein